MKGFAVLFSTCILSGVFLLACQRSSSVYAGNEEYKPRPAPTAEVPKRQRNRGHWKIDGELTRVDLENKMIFVRIDSGTMPLTFNDCTEVEGVDEHTFSGASALVGREGSDVTVQWADVKGLRLALLIEVGEGSPAKK